MYSEINPKLDTVKFAPAAKTWPEVVLASGDSVGFGMNAGSPVDLPHVDLVDDDNGGDGERESFQLCGAEEDDGEGELRQSMQEVLALVFKDGNIKDALKELDKYLPQQKDGKTIPPEKPLTPYGRVYCFIMKGSLILDFLEDTAEARKCFQGATKELDEVRKAGVKPEHEYLLQHRIGMVQGNSAFLEYYEAIADLDRSQARNTLQADREKYARAARAHFEKSLETYKAALEQMDHKSKASLKKEIAEDPKSIRWFDGPLKATLIGYSACLKDYATVLERGDAKDKERAAALRKQAAAVDEREKSTNATPSFVRQIGGPILKK